MPTAKRPAASTKPLAVKMGVKPGMQVLVLHAPKGFEKNLALPNDVAASTKLGKEHAWVLTFYESLSEAKAELPKIVKTLTPAGSVWVAWRKGGVGELTRDNLWPVAAQAGLGPAANVSLDAEWSALRFMRPKEQRG